MCIRIIYIYNTDVYKQAHLSLNRRGGAEAGEARPEELPHRGRAGQW